MKKVFITGISGCVGHYLFDELSKKREDHLSLLVRQPQKLKFKPADFPNVTLIQDDLQNIRQYSKLLNAMDQIVHLSADWGSGRGNYEQTLEMFELLDPKRCEKVIYFSTASLLGSDNQPLKEAEMLGTPYIRSKYQFHKKLPELPIYPKVITLFPTWVLGGDETHPYSHASAGIRELKQWLWLIRFFTVDASFHYIHARDIARITSYLLENEVKEREFVLGNPPVTASQFLRETCEFYGQRVYFQIPVSLSLVKLLTFLIGKKLHTWDLFCFKKKHFIYKAHNAETFGLGSD